MKAKSKTYLTTTIFLLALILLLLPSVYAQTYTHSPPYTWNKVPVRENDKIYNRGSTTATDLHFVLTQKESWIYINGWQVWITVFDESDSWKIDDHHVQIQAWDGSVPVNEYVEYDVILWLTESNTIWHEDVVWTPSEAKAVPDNGWKVGCAQFSHDETYIHKLLISNNDATEDFTVSGLAWKADMGYIDDLTTITGWGPTEPDFVVQKGTGCTIDIPTIGSFVGGYIYFKYDILWNGDTVLKKIGGHPVTFRVGGVLVPVDKLGLLAPYIGLASTIVVATVATAIYVKRVKRREDK